MDPTKGAVEISLLLKAHLKQFNRTMITMTENMKRKVKKDNNLIRHSVLSQRYKALRRHTAIECTSFDNGNLQSADQVHKPT